AATHGHASAVVPFPQPFDTGAGGGDRPEPRDGDAVEAVRAVAGGGRAVAGASVPGATHRAAAPALAIALSHAPPPRSPRLRVRRSPPRPLRPPEGRSAPPPPRPLEASAARSR